MAASLRCYVPKALQKQRGMRQLFWSCMRQSSTQVSPKDQQDVEFPPVKPRFPPGKWGDVSSKWAWEQHTKGQQLLAIAKAKERLEEISETSQAEESYWYGTVAYDEDPRTLEYKQHITKTCLVHGMPDTYASMDVDAEMEQIQPIVIQGILEEECEHYSEQWEALSEQQRISNPAVKVKSFLQKVFNDILVTLSPRHEYLLRSQTDEDVRVNAFWARTGFSSDEQDAEGREPVEGIFSFQYKYHANYQVRTELPLNSVCKFSFTSQRSIIRSGIMLDLAPGINIALEGW